MSFFNFLFEFFKIGSFTYGGGLAMIPILRDIAIDHAWLTDAQFTDLIAISQSTPGPIAINMATYIGFGNYGVIGSILASILIVLPSFVLSIILGRTLKKYNKHPYIQAAFIGLKATVVGLIAAAIVQVALVSLYKGNGGTLSSFWVGIDYKAVLLLVFSYFAVRTTQKHPIFYVLFGGVIGILLWR